MADFRRFLPTGRLPALLFALFVGVFAAGVPTASAHADGAIAQLDRFVAETASARGEFTQRTLGTAGQAGQAASGKFAFSRPGKFRWEVLKPFEQLVVADGERIHFFDQDLNQVTVRRLETSLGASPAAILFGSNDLSNDFALSEAGSNDGLDWLDAKPNSTEAGFDGIRIGFRDGLPRAMAVRDAFGRTTEFTFTEIERNPAIDSSVFRFVAPRGADVIEE